MSNSKVQKKSSKMDHFDAMAKIAIIGDSSVGKTNLLLRYTNQQYHATHVATIGIDFKVKTIGIDDFNLKLQIWDTAGQQRFRNLTSTIYQGAQAIILVYAVNERKTYDNLAKWLSDIQTHSQQNTILAIIGNKCDLEADRQIKKEQAQNFADKAKAIFMETSAIENINVDDIFRRVGERIKEKFVAEKKTKANTEKKQGGTAKEGKQKHKLAKNDKQKKQCDC